MNKFTSPLMISSMKVVVPVRNAEQWVGRCIDSVATQVYDGEWSCIVVDDASSDSTRDAITRAIASIASETVRARFKVRFNNERVGALANFVEGFKALGAEAEPESVLVQIDGDDWLYGPVVFQILRSTYEQTGCWMSWGSYAEWPNGALGMAGPMPNEAHVNGDYRSRPWVTSALRTFKAHLWYSVNDSDLRGQDGKYYDVTWDAAHMFPMIEMARERSTYIPNLLYCYNRATPFSDDKIHRQRQLSVEAEIRKKAPYSRKTDIPQL